MVLDFGAQNSLEIGIECHFSMPRSHLAIMKLGVQLNPLRAIVVLQKSVIEAVSNLLLIALLTPGTWSAKCITEVSDF